MDYNAVMKDHPLIFLHGWGMNSRLFEPLLQQMDSRPCVTPGLPGYHESLWSGGMSFECQLERMQMDLPAGSLVGWSLGGLYAIGLALRYPQKFDSLTLIACNPCFVKKPGWECAVDSSIFETFCSDLMQDWKPTLRRFLALQMQGESNARDITRALIREILAMPDPDLEVLRFGLELLNHQDARNDLGNLEQPVKMILGERDRLVPLSLRQQIHEVAPAIQVESVAGAAHAPFLSHPAQIAAML
jgi:pimeloyl-[acyl-carrier protein] methyl ester esterase